MERLTLAQLKSEVYELVADMETDIDFVMDGADRRVRANWEKAYDTLTMLKAEADKHEEELVKQEAEEQTDWSAYYDSEEGQKELADVEAKFNDYTVEDAVAMSLVIDNIDSVALTQQLFTSGGFSHWFNGEKKNYGYSVGNNTFSYKVPNIRYATLDAQDTVIDAIETFVIYVLAKGRFDGIGGWLDTDTNTLYIDPIIHMTFLGEALDLALENKELAIYNLLSKECHNVYAKDDERLNDELYVEERTIFTSDKHCWYTVYNLENDAAVGFVADYTF